MHVKSIRDKHGQRKLMQCNTTQHNAQQYATTQRNTIQHNPIQHVDTGQNMTIQHDT